MSDQFYLSKDDEISPQNQETLLQITSMIRLSEGFRLGFVKCNQPIVRSRLAARLKEMLSGEADIVIVELNEPVSSLRRSVLEALNKQSSSGKRAIMVFGFEHSVPSHGTAPSLDELNMSRDSFPESFSDPVLIWLPDYALTRLAREAPDFWGWRSGVFEFSPEKKMMAFFANSIMQDEEIDSLDLADKKERIEALEGLIRDYLEMQRSKREDQSMAEVIERLALIHYQSGELKEAKKLFDQRLKISQELNDKIGFLKALRYLGDIAYLAGNLEEARSLYEQNLKLSQDLGDRHGVSKMLHQIGMLAEDSGDRNAAHDLYMKSLEIKKSLGDISGMSKSLHNLGNLAFFAGSFSEARRYYEESLEISRRLSDKGGVSKTLHQLGNLAYVVGDLSQARNLYEQSLKISKDLGSKSDSAIALAQLSLLDENEGNFERALELNLRAEALYSELGSSMKFQVQKNRKRLEKKRSKS